MSDYYKLRRISDIDFRNDGRVAVIGKIQSIGSKSLRLEDGKNSVEVLFDKIEGVEPEKLYKIFCSIEGKKLHAHIFQDLNSFDMNLFNKIEELYRKAGV